jgi:hypothetical protein
MRWLISYVVGAVVAAGLFMLFLGYGIGGCDCGPQERGFFCWLCDHQWVYAAFATSPLWITAALQQRSNRLQHRRDLLGGKGAE